MDKQPEALRMAEWLEQPALTSLDNLAAKELRRLHQVNQNLVEALEWAYRYAIDNADQKEYPFDWAIYCETLYQTLAKHKEQA